MGKYTSLNVLNKSKLEDELSIDAVQQVAGMINSSGMNRSQRRRLEKSLSKMSTILEYSQNRLDRSAYKEYQKAVDKNFIHFFACLGLTMIDDYKWKESPDNAHGQISSLFDRVSSTIDKYANQGCSTEDILKILEEKTGIELISDIN